MDDLIRRKMANDEMKQAGADGWCTDCKEYDTEKHCCPRFNRVIRETLTEIKAQTNGKWIPDNDSGRHETRFMCSACGETDRVPTIMGEPIWRFCPWCGARMEDSDE